MAETDRHRIIMNALIGMLDFFFIDDPLIYVSGNMLMYYVRDDKRKHVSPDVFVVKGIRKCERLHYLLWEERKRPNIVIEVTSKTTRKEDIDTKFVLYRDALRIKEYFLFDPFGDYLKPDRLRGFRLRKGEYEPIALVDGRMPSKELGLHLERDGDTLRLYNPLTKAWLLTTDERAEQERRRADRAEQELVRLRKEIEQNKRRNGA
jgi:Putative restriction endonuclease